MFEPVNITKELLKERNDPSLQKELLETAHELLARAADADEKLLTRLKKGKGKNTVIDPLVISRDIAAVFTQEQIMQICVKYRLRFLDSKYFAGHYPPEALAKIHAFERSNTVDVKEFRIMAPTKMYRLIDPDKDPLLFASLGNGNYYLIHQWGNDLVWYRKFLAWPLRSLKHLLITIVSFALLASLMLPASFFLNDASSATQTYPVRMMFFLLTFIATLFLMVNISLRSDRSLSEVEWDNKYLH